jgi:hypothetical protein
MAKGLRIALPQLLRSTSALLSIDSLMGYLWSAHWAMDSLMAKAWCGR